MAQEEKKKTIVNISSGILKLKEKEAITLTTLAKNIGIHPYTLMDVIDMFDTLKDIGFKTIRDRNKKIRLIIKTDEELRMKNDIKLIRKDILDIKSNLDLIIKDYPNPFTQGGDANSSQA